MTRPSDSEIANALYGARKCMDPTVYTKTCAKLDDLMARLAAAPAVPSAQSDGTRPRTAEEEQIELHGTTWPPREGNDMVAAGIAPSPSAPSGAPRMTKDQVIAEMIRRMATRDGHEVTFLTPEQQERYGLLAHSAYGVLEDLEYADGEDVYPFPSKPAGTPIRQQIEDLPTYFPVERGVCSQVSVNAKVGRFGDDTYLKRGAVLALFPVQKDTKKPICPTCKSPCSPGMDAGEWVCGMSTCSSYMMIVARAIVPSPEKAEPDGPIQDETSPLYGWDFDAVDRQINETERLNDDSDGMVRCVWANLRNANRIMREIQVKHVAALSPEGAPAQEDSPP